MSVALISDIHANLPALEAVINDMPEVDEVLCAGDIVGYNPWPAECVDRIRSLATMTVQGNHDRTVNNPEAYFHNYQAEAGLNHAKSKLSDEQKEWLQALPKHVEFANGNFRLVHSHPDSDNLGSYVFPRNFPEMRPYLDKHQGIVLGHTHIQHKAEIDGRLIVNPGSVGQPRDGTPSAAYAILDPENKRVEFRRVEYDINQVISKVESVGLPTEVGTRLLDGS